MKLENTDPGRFKFTPWNATTFFIPLAIQAMSQSLTYPLVAAIVSHGPHGALELAAFMQGLLVMFLFGTLGYGLVTTGMVFAKTRVGYTRFAQVNRTLMWAVAIIQILVALPPIAPLIFERLLNMPPELSQIARLSMLFSVPTQMAFFMRNVPQVVLYNEHETSIANFATLGRIAITAMLSPIFRKLGLVGWQWGVVALTIPVVMELCLTWYFARPYVRQLRDDEEPPPPAQKIFLFNIPLSLGGFLLSTATFMLNAIINRTENGAVMLAVHMIAMGVVNPMSFGALRCQAVAIGFPQRNVRDQRTFIFSLCAGASLACILLLSQIPAVANWYFGTVQNLQCDQIRLARHVMLVATCIPILQALRGHAEGLAAYRKRPNAVLAGQAVFLASLLVTLFVLWQFKTPGYLMGIYAISISTFMTFLTIRLGLLMAWFEEPLPPIPPRVQHHT